MDACQQKTMSEARLAAGTWWRAAFLLLTSTTMPTFLGLPAAFASMGWAGGVVCLVFACGVLLYCNCLLAALQEFKGRRHYTTRHIAAAVFGVLLAC